MDDSTKESTWIGRNWWWLVTIYLFAIGILIWYAKVDLSCGNGIDWLTLVVAVLPITPILIHVLPISEIGPVKFTQPKQSMYPGEQGGLSLVTDKQKIKDTERKALESAQSLISQGRLGDIGELLLPLIKNNPKNISAATILGLLYGEGPQQDFQKSIFYSKLALFNDPNNFAALMNLGLAYRHKGCVQEREVALDCFRSVTRILRQNTEPNLVIERGKNHLFAALMLEDLDREQEYTEELKLAQSDLSQHPNIQSRWLEDVENRLRDIGGSS